MTYLLIFSTFLTALLLPTISHANRIEKINRFGNWTAYVYEAEGKTVCFAASRPQELRPRSLRRHRVRAYVSTWKPDTPEGDKKRIEEASILIGTQLKPGKGSAVQIGKKHFDLFGSGETLYMSDREKEKLLVKEMRSGHKMSVVAETSDGTRTLDIFSLRGVSKALDNIRKACE